MSLSPRYTDYKYAVEVIDAYISGKDFTLNDISSKWNGKACSIRDFPDQRVELRYANEKKITAYQPRP